MCSAKPGNHLKCKYLACSKRSDSGERGEVKKAMKSKGGLGREVRERSLSHLSPSLALIFSRSFLLRTAPHYLDAWNRLSRRWSPSTPLGGQKSVIAIGSLTYSYPSWFFSRYFGLTPNLNYNFCPFFLILYKQELT